VSVTINDEFSKALQGNIDSIKYVLGYPKYYTRRAYSYRRTFALNVLQYLPELSFQFFYQMLKTDIDLSSDLLSVMVYRPDKYVKSIYAILKNFDHIRPIVKEFAPRFSEKVKVVFHVDQDTEMLKYATYLPLKVRKKFLEDGKLINRYVIAYTMHQLKYDGIYQTVKHRIKELTEKDSYKLKKGIMYFTVTNRPYEKSFRTVKVFFISASMRTLKYPDQLSYVQTQDDFDHLVEFESARVLTEFQLGLFLRYNSIAQKNIDKLIEWLKKSELDRTSIQKVLVYYNTIWSVDHFPDIMLESH